MNSEVPEFDPALDEIVSVLRSIRSEVNDALVRRDLQVSDSGPEDRLAAALGEYFVSMNLSVRSLRLPYPPPPPPPYVPPALVDPFKLFRREVSDYLGGEQGNVAVS